MKTKTITCAVLVLAGLLLAGTRPPPDAGSRMPGFLSFRVCALDRIDSPLVLNSANGEVSIVPPQAQRSRSIEAYLPPELSFFTAQKGRASPAARPASPAAEVTLPRAVQQPLLLFEDAPSRGADKYNVFVVEDSWKAFPSGTVRVLNLSTLPMAARVAGHDLQIAPGGQQVTQIEDGQATHVEAKVALNGPDGWSVGYDTVHQIVPRVRFLLACRAVPEAGGKVGLKVALLRDFEPNSAALER